MVILINTNNSDKWFLLDPSQCHRIIVANDRDELEEMGFEKVEDNDTLLATADVYNKKIEPYEPR